ncbi:MAG: D-alanyl-D-alanine carboxypeptidase family protein [Mycobacteriales bacterium]
MPDLPASAATARRSALDRVALAAVAVLALVIPIRPTETAPASAAPASVGGARLATTGVVHSPGTLPLPASATSDSWLVADGATGRILAAKNPHGRYAPASTQKVLTALTLLPVLADRTRTVIADRSDVSSPPDLAGLVAGGTYPVGVLFECMLLVSANDCANALARANGGGPKTVAAMNATATHLNADDTRVRNVTGLDSVGQTTSAYDLALIMRAAAERPDFLQYDAKPDAVLPEVPNRSGLITFANGNHLVGNYAGAVAAKTGYSDAGLQTYVAVLRKDNRTMIVSLMHGDRAGGDVWLQAVDLAEWGFQVPATAKGVGVLVEPGRAHASAPPTPARSTAPTTRPTRQRPAPAPAPPDPATRAAAAASGRTTDPWLPWFIGVGVVLALAMLGVGLSMRHRPAH